MQTANATTTDPTFDQEFAQVDSEPQQQQQRDQQGAHQHVNDNVQQAISTRLAGARQRSAGGRQLAAAHDVDDVSANGNDTDRRQRGQQQPDDTVAAVDARLGSAVVVLLDPGESDPPRRVPSDRLHLDTGLRLNHVRESEPIRRAEL